HVRASRFAARAADEQAGRENHDAERPDVGHPNIPTREFDFFAGEFHDEEQTHRDVGKENWSGDGLMKMRRQPGSVVHDNVEIVGGVNDSGDTAEDKNDEAAKEVAEEPAFLVDVRKLFPPA